MAITTASQSQLGQDTAKNSQIVTTSVRLVNSGASTGPSISSIIVTDSGYNTIDDTAAATSNSYIRILGTGFTSTANVFLNGTMVPKANVTFVSSSELRAVLPVSNTGSYAVGVFNSNSAGALYSSSFVISTMPQWLTSATLNNAASDTPFSITLSATSDSSVTYANTTALPAGTTLAANGLFSGTISTGTETTYSFDVKATDAENQDSSRTFQVTVTVGPGPGAMYTWGRNNSASLGLSDSTYRSSPTQVGSATNWKLVSVGTYETSAIKTDGTLWYWGRNYFGAAGLNDSNQSKNIPTQIGTNTNWNLSTIGTYAHLAIKTDGTLWAWGSNQRGTMGNNAAQIGTGASSPVQIGTNTNWSLVDHSGYSVLAIKTNGTLWAWGNNFYGEVGLGAGDTTNRSSPTQVGTNTNWSLIKNGQYQNAAIKTDGTLWTWGYNNYGQLGNNSMNTIYSPTQVGSATNWRSINCIDHMAIAIKTDGTLWTWGRNQNGQLGHGNTVYQSSPTQVGTATNWKTCSASRLGPSMATKTDGTLWTWGNNHNGQSGTNNLIVYSSPVQIGSKTTWQTIRAGFFSAAAISTT